MKKHAVILLMIIAYAAGVVGYTVVSYQERRSEIIAGVDQRLVAAATAIPFIIGQDYHDGIVDADSRDRGKNYELARKLTAYARENGLDYLYTFMRFGDEIRFVISSLSEEDWSKAEPVSEYFLPYPEASDLLKGVFDTPQTVFEEEGDRWGVFRSVLIGKRNAKGEVYVLGADLSLRDLDLMLRDGVLQSLVTGLFFLLLLVPMGILYVRLLERDKRSLQLVIDKRTRELQHTNTELKKTNQLLEGLSASLSKYLSPQVYNSIFTGRQQVKLETRRKKLTVFFSDIKDFTRITENMQPEDLTWLLNQYISEMSTIALNYGATIDKFIGDAMLIFFGDPETRGVKEDAHQCVAMALAMRQRVEELRDRWLEAGMGQSLRVRIGISSGFCNVGNFGSEHKMDYTIIGSTVNLAQRLETAAASDQILVAEETYLLLKDEVEFEPRGQIDAKGFDKPVRTYAVVGLNTSEEARNDLLRQRLDRFFQTLDTEWRDMNPDTLVDLFRTVLVKRRGDE
ncbi:MAG: adenylate/guanylate cyclase domain-containing protein [Chromatiales bacterium]|nr:adenylate/guanylate cyclase domain-containing protein [Chromatiales bacterium]